MLFHKYLWSFIFLSCLLIGFVWCAYSRRSIIPLFLLGIVWNACVPFGVAWNGVKVLVICTVALWFLRRERFPKLSHAVNPKILISLSLYVITMTIIGALTLADTTLNSMQDSIFQKTPLRGLIATGFWFFGPICFLVGYRYTYSSRTIDNCVKVILLSSMVAAIIAIIQIVTYYTFPGVERLLAFFCPASIEGPATTVTESGIWGWYRPAPFCTESRHFGFAMAFAAVTVILSRRFALKSVPRFLNHYVWIIIYVVLCFASASTSAIAGMFFALGGLILWLFLIKNRDVITGKEGVKILAVLLISFSLLFVIEKRSGAIIKRFDHYLYRYGLYNRPADWFQDSDQSVTAAAYLSWLLDSPSALILGVGPGNATFCAFPYFSDKPGVSGTKMLLSSRLPIIDSIGAIGLSGSFLLVFFLWCCWRICRIYSMTVPDTTLTRILFLRGTLVFLMLYSISYDPTLLIWLLFGILIRLSSNQQYAMNNRLITH